MFAELTQASPVVAQVAEEESQESELGELAHMHEFVSEELAPAELIRIVPRTAPARFGLVRRANDR
jgi:hypothetical protein